MAAGGGKGGCKLLRDAALQSQVDRLSEIGSGHRTWAPKACWILLLPLRLRLIRAIIQAADDPDRDFLLRAEEGLPVGIPCLKESPSVRSIVIPGNPAWPGFLTTPRLENTATSPLRKR